MSGICSAHRHNDPTCAACQAHPRDIFSNWDEMVEEAKVAGLFKCVCGFDYYLTTDRCPLCNRILEGTRHGKV